MRVSEATTTNKRVLTLNDIKGVDLSSAPLRVKQTRASYMKNMICKGGENHKRNGFEQVASFYDEEGKPLRINGIFPYKSEGEECKIVHAGASLYKCSSDFLIREQISLDGVELGSEKSQGYLNKDDLYIIAGDRLLVYDGEKVGALFDSENAYVPTTSIGITDDAHGSLMQPFEGVNLFSTKRINKLSGAKRGTIKASSTDESQSVFTLEGSAGTFILDGEIDLTKKVVIKTEVFIDGKLNKYSDNEAALPVVANYHSETYQKTDIKVSTIFTFPVGTVSTKGISSFMDGTIKIEIDGFAEVSGHEGSFVGDFECKIANVDGRGVVTFTPALPSPVLGEDNITVEYYTKQEAPRIKAACECSVNTYSKMLEIAADDDIVYYSSPSEGYSYFPDNNYIKALDNVSTLFAGGDFLAICSQAESAIVSFSVDSSGERIVCVPSLVSKRADVGCLAPLSSAYVEGDTLFLSDKGIYGASIGGIHMRSSNINKELLSFGKDKLRDAVSIECDGRYYLFVDGIVYIADARYKTYESNRLDVSYEYEWWRWENCHCRVATVHMGKILLGREDGRILMLGEGYSDISYYVLNSSEVLTDGHGFTFNDELGVNADDLVKIENAYKLLTGGEYVQISDSIAQIRFDDEELLRILSREILFVGQNVRIYIKATREMVDTTINAIDLMFRGAIEFSYSPASYGEPVTNTGAIIFAMCESELFTPQLVEDTEEDIGDFVLVDSYGEEASFVELDNMRVTLIKKEPVECELHSAVLNLGTDIKKKTLHKLVLVPGVDTLGEVEIGYETDRKNSAKKQAVTTELDFSAVDFNSFTFDSLFYRSFERRLHERNVQFVKFKFKSLGKGDFSIENFSCVFSINTR